MKEITSEKLRELENNQEFLEKLRTVSSSPEAIEVLAEYGVEMTEDELMEGFEKVESILVEKGYMKDGELTESGLDLVSGGVNMWVSGVGIAGGSAGLLLMMAGVAGGPAVWAAGCIIGAAGIFMKGRKKRR